MNAAACLQNAPSPDRCAGDGTAFSLTATKLRLPNGSVVVMTPCAIERRRQGPDAARAGATRPRRDDLPSGKVGRELVKKRAPLCVNQSVTTSTPSTRRRTRVSTVGKQPDPFVLHTMVIAARCTLSEDERLGSSPWAARGVAREHVPVRWRGDAGSSPLDGASTATSSPRNELVKNYRAPDTLVDFQGYTYASGTGPRGDTAKVFIEYLGQRRVA